MVREVEEEGEWAGWWARTDSLSPQAPLSFSSPPPFFFPPLDSKHPRADPSFLQRRELCFTLDGDIFVRYLSFKVRRRKKKGGREGEVGRSLALSRTLFSSSPLSSQSSPHCAPHTVPSPLPPTPQDAASLRRAILARIPAKIDIGPVYTVDPARRAAYASGSATTAAAAGAAGAAPSGFAPVERELVFDVDLTDYDDVRTCGSGGHICARCWPLMAAAVAVVDAALDQDFGFAHRLWVFSGRRGVHCWVSDARARGLTDEARSAVAAYLSLYKGVEEGVARLALPPLAHSTTPLHPSVDRAAALLDGLWTSSILPAQRWLDGPATWDTVLAHVPDEAVKARLVARWTREGPIAPDNDGAVSVRRWGELEAELAREARPVAGDARNPAAREHKAALGRACLRAVLAVAYPRLDVDVSKKRNHLLKAPFCVHPKTGKVCVPFEAAEAASFDPDGVPTVGDLVADAKKSKGGGGGGAAAGGAPGWAGSALEPAIRFFADKFLAPLAVDSKAALAAKAKDAAAAPTMAW